MDTSVGRDFHLIMRDPNRADFHGGWVEGDLVIGNPVVNDKGPMAAFMIATRALRDAKVDLAGSVYLNMVAGEIGREPVDEFQGKRYLSKEVGARYLLNHSPRPNYCLCAEATSFRKGWVEAGKAFYKLTVFGGPALYTPFLNRPYSRDDQPNAILRAVPLLERLEEWALDYEQQEPLRVARRHRRPARQHRRDQVGRAVDDPHQPRGLHALPRHQDGAWAGRRRDPPRVAGPHGRVWARGEGRAVRQPQRVRSDGIEPLADAVDEAHRASSATECEIADSPECSMWRDHNVYNEMGIPALTYGPPGRAGTGAYAVARADLLTRRGSTR